MTTTGSHFKRGRNTSGLLVGKKGTQAGRRSIYGFHRWKQDVAKMILACPPMPRAREPIAEIHFNSKGEANWARFLELLRSRRIVSQDSPPLVNWLYEPCTFWFPVSRGVTNYTPDYLLLYSNRNFTFHELKGWMDKRSKTALGRMGKFFPEIPIEVIDWKRYKQIERKLSHIIPGWEFAKKEEQDD